MPLSGGELKYWGATPTTSSPLVGRKLCQSPGGAQWALATAGKVTGKVNHKAVYLPQLEKCAQDLGSTSKAVGSSMAQLLTCAAQGNEDYTGTKAPCSGSLPPGVAKGRSLPRPVISPHVFDPRKEPQTCRDKPVLLLRTICRSLQTIPKDECCMGLVSRGERLTDLGSRTASPQISPQK